MAKILVVEDEAPNVEILTRLLRRKGYDVIVAGNKEDAIATARTELPDLILMDIGIPESPGGMHRKDAGTEATRVLKSDDQTRAIRIVALTAHTMIGDRQLFLEAGCDDIQSKPFEFTDLLRTIETQLEAGTQS